MSKVALRNRLLEVTRPGRVTDWVERIAELAESIGVPLEYINWSASPEVVAHEVVTKADNRGWTNKLEAAIESRRPREEPTLFYESTPCSG